MADTEVGESDELSANTEIRILTLELMKLAAKKRKPFVSMVKEYIRNTYTLKRMLEEQTD